MTAPSAPAETGTPWDPSAAGDHTAAVAALWVTKRPSALLAVDGNGPESPERGGGSLSATGTASGSDRQLLHSGGSGSGSTAGGGPVRVSVSSGVDGDAASGPVMRPYVVARAGAPRSRKSRVNILFSAARRRVSGASQLKKLVDGGGGGVDQSPT